MGHSAVILGFGQLLFYFHNSFIPSGCFALLVDYRVGQLPAVTDLPDVILIFAISSRGYS